MVLVSSTQATVHVVSQHILTLIVVILTLSAFQLLNETLNPKRLEHNEFRHRLGEEIKHLIQKG